MYQINRDIKNIYAHRDSLVDKPVGPHRYVTFSHDLDASTTDRRTKLSSAQRSLDTLPNHRNTEPQMDQSNLHPYHNGSENMFNNEVLYFTGQTLGEGGEALHHHTSSTGEPVRTKTKTINTGVARTKVSLKQQQKSKISEHFKRNLTSSVNSVSTSKSQTRMERVKLPGSK
jgi:hypothetical protein